MQSLEELYAVLEEVVNYDQQKQVPLVRYAILYVYYCTFYLFIESMMVLVCIYVASFLGVFNRREILLVHVHNREDILVDFLCYVFH